MPVIFSNNHVLLLRQRSQGTGFFSNLMLIVFKQLFARYGLFNERQLCTCSRDSGDCMETTWRLHEDCMETAWRPHGDCMETAFRLLKFPIL